MSDIVHRETYHGYTITLYPDFDPPNPRTDFDPLGTITMNRVPRRLNDPTDKDAVTLPDPKTHYHFELGKYLEDCIVKTAASRSPGLFRRRYLTLFCDVAVALPVSYSEHAFSTWDTLSKGDDPDGFLYLTRDQLAAEFGTGPDAATIAAGSLKASAEEFNQWCQGEVFGYVITAGDDDDDSDEEPTPRDSPEIDSLWGLFGYDYALQSAREVVDDHRAYRARLARARAFHVAQLALSAFSDQYEGE